MFALGAIAYLNVVISFWVWWSYALCYTSTHEFIKEAIRMVFKLCTSSISVNCKQSRNGCTLLHKHSHILKFMSCTMYNIRTCRHRFISYIYSLLLFYWKYQILTIHRIPCMTMIRSNPPVRSLVE
jgi:hypothetical protein